MIGLEAELLSILLERGSLPAAQDNYDVLDAVESLKTKGLAFCDGDEIQLTEAGRELAGKSNG